MGFIDFYLCLWVLVLSVCFLWFPVFFVVGIFLLLCLPSGVCLSSGLFVVCLLCFCILSLLVMSFVFCFLLFVLILFTFMLFYYVVYSAFVYFNFGLCFIVVFAVFFVCRVI